MKCSRVAMRNATERIDRMRLYRHLRLVCKWIALLLFNCFLALLMAAPAHAQPSAPPDPALVVRKSGPATMNLGRWGNFNIDVQNIGQSDAWNVSLRDLAPNGATGGMCNRAPQILSAQVFAADG